jgi:ABC-2 type transport system permease protein
MPNELSKLWNKRAKAFWKEAAIYWSYAARSGLTAFLLLFIIIGFISYKKILDATPSDYPYWRILSPVLAAVIAWSPIRTFLKSADTVFLTPAELKLHGYWLRSLLYSMILQTLALLAVLLLVWPLYVHCEGDQALPFAFAAAILITAKLLAIISRFYESRLLYSFQRAAASVIRWIAALILPFALFVQGYSAAWGALLLSAVVMAVMLVLLPKHRIPWDLWIQKEVVHLKNHYTFFSWFADVPKLQVKPKSRMLLARRIDKLPFDSGETYRYLYAKTLIRSEWFSILARIVGIAVILFLVVENTVAETLIYAVALIMASATVSSLEQSHRYSFWLELYPVPKSQRTEAIVRTCAIVLLQANTIIGAAFILFHGSKAVPLAAAAIGFLYIWYFTRYPLRKKSALHDEE